jgi:hypothetical protein
MHLRLIIGSPLQFLEEKIVGGSERNFRSRHSGTAEEGYKVIYNNKDDRHYQIVLAVFSSL